MAAGQERSFLPEVRKSQLSSRAIKQLTKTHHGAGWRNCDFISYDNLPQLFRVSPAPHPESCALFWTILERVPR